MSLLLLFLVLVATVLVILSGVWVTLALIEAVWRVERPGDTSSADAADKTSL